MRAYIAVGFTVHLAALVGTALLHRSQSQTVLRRRRGRLLWNELTVLDVWRLSVWLLARILNLSVQASRSSFTPTTESSEVNAKMSESLCQDAVPSPESPPAGLMVFPPTAISTAVLTRIPMVSFSGLRKSSLALRAKQNEEQAGGRRARRQREHPSPDRYGARNM